MRTWASKQSRKSPVITRDCREPRDVVFETDRIEGIENTPMRHTNTKLSPRWFDSTTDIPTLLLFPGTDSAHYRSKDSVPLLFDYAVQCQTAMIPAERVCMWEIPLGRPKWEILSQLKNWVICLQEVPIYVTRKDMIDSQLFGQLGEEHIQLVDPLDTATLQRFCDLVERSEAREGYQAQLFSKKPKDVKSFHVRVKEWMRNAIWDLVQAERFGEEWVFVESDPENTLLELQTRDKVPRQQSISKFSNEEFRTFFAELAQLFPNDQHPKVQEVLASLLTLHPRIVFRPYITEYLLPFEIHRDSKGEEGRAGGGGGGIKK
ncbi:hypothetical protein NUU61_005674 [Penicillium alfredii]|uniref:Uncharacterized protein n=1 Tax=Penicillium alfredii TaxID=1506179 RepID=A0A9W9F9X1_9EURO|nr:uncharacterized protein NUU61_005674 [Penicillium alfredii]KAJ5096318.1 hypothetical protein NUU61_005674 [Penicillium alfredii]